MRFANAEHTIIDLGDGRFVPVDPDNADFAALDTGVPIAPFQRFAGFSLEAARAQLVAEVDAIASARRVAIVGTADPTKLSVYTEKYQIALRALAGDSDALALLAPEAQARGESPEALAALVKALGDQWRAASFAIEAQSSALKSAIAGIASLVEAEAFRVGGEGW